MSNQIAKAGRGAHGAAVLIPDGSGVRNPGEAQPAVSPETDTSQRGATSRGSGGYRRLMLLGVLPLVAVAVGGSWAASKWIVSPADIVARTAPPAPSPILVPVEQRELSSEIITRGTGRFGIPQEIAISPSGLKPAAGLITTLPALNTQVEEGQVLLTASGRPVFVLRGKTPAYRNMVPGNTGEDVRQLEEALAGLGHEPGSIDGHFDAQTSAAIERWYAASGWDPFGSTPEQIAAVRVLERSLEDAKRAYLAALASASTAAAAVQAARADAAREVRRAEAELGAKGVDHGGSPNHGGNESLAVESARSKALYAVRAAQADLDAAIAERSLIVLDPRQPEPARAAANAKLELARAALEQARVDGRLAVNAAERNSRMAAVSYRLAQDAVESARQVGQARVRAALDAKRIADLDAVFAKKTRERVAADLESAKSKLGIQVPIDEIVFLPALPVRVQELKVSVGQEARGPLLSVTDNQLSIDSSLTLEAAPLVEAGMPVFIDEQSLGIKAKGVVEFVASTPGTRGADGYHVYFEVRVLETTGRLENVSVRLTIPTKSTSGEVLALPVSAVSLAGDGTSRVRVQRDGKLEFVVVEPGMSADGYVEVTPVGGTLSPGELVVVGYENPTPTAIQ